MEINRIFLIILDSFGIGAAPDAADFGDVGANTLASCAASPALTIPHMRRLGLGNIDGVTCLAPDLQPVGAFARPREASRGKDTTVGHWELAGLVSPRPLPTYPNGFPPDVIREFERRTGAACCATAHTPARGDSGLRARANCNRKINRLHLC